MFSHNEQKGTGIKMATIWDETKLQASKMKGRPFKEKVQYFWEYYRIATAVVICVLAIVISLIHAAVTAKDYALSVLMVNSLGESFHEVVEGYESDLTELMDFNTKKYEVSIDDSLSMGTDNVSADIEYATMQKLAAMVSSKSADLFIANTSVFEQYSQNEYLMDLRTIYTEDELAQYSDIIYYSDAATYSDYELTSATESGADKQRRYNIDHHDPSSMKDPVPCGFFLSGNSPIAKAELYSYFNDTDTFQGYKETGIIGVFVNTPRTAESRIGLDYFIGATGR